MHEFLTANVIKHIKKTTLTGTVYIYMCIGIFCIMTSIFSHLSIINVGKFLIGIILIITCLSAFRYILAIKKGNVSITPVIVINKEKYDPCRAAQMKYNSSYVSLKKKNNDVIDRKISMMRTFNNINIGDSGIIISAAGLNHFYTFNELDLNYSLSDCCLGPHHVGSKVFTPLGIGVLTHRNILLNTNVCNVKIDENEKEFNIDEVWLMKYNHYI